MGNPTIITDGGGMVVARHDYMAFGNDVTESIGTVGGRATAQGYNAPEEVRQGYTGYEKDDESGLDFAQARYYNSAHGRFTSVDPLTASASIKDPQTFNRYSYGLNSPYKFTDPLGLLSQTSGSACGQWCANSDGSSGSGAFDSAVDGGFCDCNEYGEVEGYALNQPDNSVVVNGEVFRPSMPLQTNTPPTLKRVYPPLSVRSYDGTPELDSYSIEVSEIQIADGKIKLPDGNFSRDDNGKVIKAYGPYVIVTYTFYDQGNSFLPGVKMKENVTVDKAEPEKLFGKLTQQKELVPSNRSGQIYDTVGLLTDKQSYKTASKENYTVEVTQQLTISYNQKTYQVINKISETNPDHKPRIGYQ